MSTISHESALATSATSQVSVRSQNESDRWIHIFHETLDSADRVSTLEIVGDSSHEPGPGSASWLNQNLQKWPRLTNLRQLELRDVDFRDIDHRNVFRFAHGGNVKELVLENARFADLAHVFEFVGSFVSLVALTVRRVKWIDRLDDGSLSYEGVPEEVDISDIRCDMPALRKLNLRDSSSETSLSRVICSMPSGLRLRSLDLHWSDDGAGLNHLLETCGDSLIELGISGIYDAELEDMISLESNKNLQTLYLNNVYLFPNERLTPPVYLLLASLSSNNLRTVYLNLSFENGARFENQLDDVDWNAVDVFLSSESCHSLQDVNVAVVLEPHGEVQSGDVVGMRTRIRSGIQERMWRSSSKINFVGP